MSYDGIFTHSMTKELKETLEGGRVAKVHQPYKNELVLVIRAARKNYRMLLSAHPQYARTHLTEIEYENPATPPHFCMVLRKYIEGAHIEKIEQMGNDRVIRMHLTHRNELGDWDTLILLVEMMGRHSNVILLNPENNRILEAIRHVPTSVNTYRSLVPGATYIPPPPQDKHNPFDVPIEGLLEDETNVDLSSFTFKDVQKTYEGLGRDSAAEVLFIAKKQKSSTPAALASFVDRIQDEEATPTLTIDNKKEHLTPIPYESLSGERISFPTLSLLCDRYYGTKADTDRAHQQSHDLIRLVANLYAKNKEKELKLQEDLRATGQMDEFRIKGEVLTAFLHEVEKGQEEILLDNFYDEGKKIKIELDPRKTPSENAQLYFKKYQKLRNAVAHLTRELSKTEKEITYLDSVKTQLELASPRDIESIREELVQEGYLKVKNQKKKPRSGQKKAGPEEFMSSDGTLLLVGKNNLQNDQLSMKTARKTDYWMHAKDIPGSHVIIRSDSPSEETIQEAGQLAAYYSKYRESASVPVDIVQVRKLKKPNGSKPGFVIYEGQNTVFVTPDIQTIRALKENHLKEN